MAAIFCYSGDSSDSVIATFSGNSDGLSHLRPSDSEYTETPVDTLENSDFSKSGIRQTVYAVAFLCLRRNTSLSL